jgi:DNA repair exonuclease SbcCD ATPase subunit
MAQHAGDLLSQGLGAKKGSEESSNPSTVTVNKAAPPPVLVGENSHNTNAPGTDLLKTTVNTGTKQTNEEDKSVKIESSANADTSGNADTGSWTLENALKEVKKVRDEAKTTRIKYQEMVKQKEEELQKQLEAEKEKHKEALEAKRKLEELERKEADKKRTLEEKVQHRDKEVADAQARAEAIERTMKQQLEAAENRIKELSALQEAQMQGYKNRLDEELAKISEDKREIANLIVKGAGDSRDALIAINEAKLKGIFEDKKVVVNHSVPGANTGARVSQNQLDANEKERRKKMSSSDLIKEGLKQAGRTSAPKMNKNSII